MQYFTKVTHSVAVNVEFILAASIFNDLFQTEGSHNWTSIRNEQKL